MAGYALVFGGADIKASTVALGIAPIKVTERSGAESKCPCPSKALLDRCREIAVEQGAEVVRSAVFDDDEGSERARLGLEAAGYQAVRDYQRMVAEVNPQGLAHQDLTIRELDSSEVGLLMELQNGSFAGHYNYSLNTLEEIRFMLDVENASKEVLVAEVDRRPIGYVWFTPKLDADKLGGIRMIGILKDWRGKGFAKVLLDSAIGALARLGATKVWLEVDTNNVAGVRAYESVGFRRYKGITWYECPTLPAPPAKTALRTSADTSGHRSVTWWEGAEFCVLPCLPWY